MEFDLFSGEERMGVEWRGTLYIGEFDSERIRDAQEWIARKKLRVELVCGSMGMESNRFHVGVRYAPDNVLRHIYDRLQVYVKLKGTLPLSSSVLLMDHVGEGAEVPHELQMAALDALRLWRKKIDEEKGRVAASPSR